MADLVRRVVFFPRFTSLVGPSAGGGNTFYTSPVQVRGFSKLIAVPYWIGTTQGNTWSMKLEASPDLVTWKQAADLAGSAGPPAVVDLPLDWEWVRVKANLVEERFTCWMVGEFLTRADS